MGYAEAPRKGKDTEEYRWKSVRGGALTAKLEGLRHYTTYSVTVRAVNQVGSGPPAQVVTVTTTQGGELEGKVVVIYLFILLFLRLSVFI